jgi:hypothetical protein
VAGCGKETEGEEGGSGGLSSGRQRADRARGEGKFGGPGSGVRREGGLQQDPGPTGAGCGR